MLEVNNVCEKYTSYLPIFYLERLFLAAGLPDGLPDLLLPEELERALLEPAVKNYFEDKK